MHARRELERRNNTLKKYAYDNATLGDSCQLVDRTDAQRKRNARRERNAQQAEIEKAQELQRERARREVLLKQEEALANELSRRKKEELRHKAMVRRVCTESEELKNLEKKLQMAYLNKERAIQLETLALTRAADEQAARDEDQAMHNYGVAIGPNNDEVARREATRRESQAKQTMILKRQHLEKEQRKIAQYEAFIKEKEQVDAIVAGIEAEEAGKEANRLAKVEETKEYIQEYLIKREKWKAEHARKAREEQQQLLAWQRQQEERLASIERAKGERRKAEAAKYKAVSGNIQKERQEQERREMLMIELAIQEAQLKIMEEEKAKVQRRNEMLERMRIEMAMQEQIRIESAGRQKLEDATLREELLAKYANDDRLDALKKDARRRKLEHHQADVQKILQHRERQREANKLEEEKDLEEQQGAERARLELVEKERMRMLVEYARKLQDYLPKGVVQTDKDYAIVYGEQPPPRVSVQPKREPEKRPF